MRMYRYNSGDQTVQDAFSCTDGDFIKCRGCNWPVMNIYIIAESEVQADELLGSGDAGLCGECMCDILSEHNYIIDHEEVKLT